MAGWGYTKKTGPHTWAVDCADARGEKQSPVDIDHEAVVADLELEQTPLYINYNPASCTAFKNTGYAWQVDVEDGDNVLTGGPLSNEYRLKQFHCHWGPNDTEGSEHTVNGVSFAGEIHLVHWNAIKYNTFEDAAKEEDGLAVLGILLQAGGRNGEIEKLCDLMPEIRFKEDCVQLQDGFHLSAIVPDDLSYWTYSGSLTTPPCSEVVTWLVLETPLEISSDQLRDFRTLLTYKRGEPRPKDEFRGFLMQNYRSPMPLKSRQVRKCKHTVFV